MSHSIEPTVPRLLTKIEAPSTLVRSLLAVFPSVVHHPDLPVYEGVPITVDDTLPVRTVRYTYSDGTTHVGKLVRLWRRVREGGVS